MMDEKQEPSFEEAMTRLEEISRRLESGEASLEESLAMFDEGMRLVRHCSRRLEEARQRVAMLVDENGEPQEVPFELRNDGNGER